MVLPLKESTPVVVLIAACGEWLPVKAILNPALVEMTPYSECFTTRIASEPVTFVHTGWGKIAAAAVTEYAIARWQPALAAGLYEGGDYDRAQAVFRLLVECFDGYAEGYNYLGLIAHAQRKLEQAIEHFQSTIVLGRKLFPARIAKSRYWRDHATRPYMRALRNLALTLNEAGRFAEALAMCDQLEHACDDASTAAWQRATVFLNTGEWTRAAEAARRTVGLDVAGSSFLSAFALFELGEHEAALELFLHGALNYPRAARMLAGEKVRGTPAVRSREEADDHNTGVSLTRALHAFLRAQSRASRRFFRDVVRDARVAKLLDESVAVVRRWHAQHPTGEREAFDRMQRMRSRQFAQVEAGILRDLLWAARPRPQVAIH